jgi:hypothetical protein
MNFDQANQIRILGDEIVDLRKEVRRVRRVSYFTTAFLVVSLFVLVFIVIAGNGYVDRLRGLVEHPQSLSIYDSKGNKMLITASEIACLSGDTPSFIIKSQKEGPSIDLYDNSGKLRSVLGVAYTINESTHDQTTTSPGHFTIFSPKGHVAWQSSEAFHDE